MTKLFSEWKKIYLSLLVDKSLPLTIQWTCVALIIVGCFIIRLQIIEMPPIEWSIWKEIDYIEISKNYVNNGLAFHRPEITWPAEPPRITAMEFPLVPYAAAIIYKFFGYNVFTVRVIPMVCWLIMIVYVFLLTRREVGPGAGVAASLAAAIMPLYHNFGNILFSEPFVIASSIASIFHFANWIDFERRRDWILALLFFSLAVALKLTPLYLLLPLSWALLRKYRYDFKSYTRFLSFVILSLVLPIIWYSYAYYLTKNSIDVFGIFGGHDKMQTMTMLSDHDWYRIMFNRLRWQILGSKVGVILFVSGLLSCILVRRGGVIFAYLISILCFFALVAEGQIDASYRQMTIIPCAAIFMSLGSIAGISVMLALLSYSNILKIVNIQRSYYWQALAIIPFVFLFYDNIENIYKDMPTQRTPKEELAVEIKKYKKEDTKLVVAGGYTIHKGGNDLSPVIYYYTGLTGWTIQKGEWYIDLIEKYKMKGASLFVAMKMSREPESLSFIKEMKKRYKVLYENEKRELLLIDLSASL